MKKLVFSLILVVFLAGCIGQQGVQTRNNGLVIQSFAFDVKEIEPEIPVTLALSVKNVGAKEVKGAFAELQGPPEWTIKVNGKSDTLPARQNIVNILPPDPDRGITEGQEDLIVWEMEAPKKETKISYPFQAVVYYSYATESDSLARIVTKDYYRQSGDRGGLTTTKSSAGPLSVIVSMPSSIISDESQVKVPLIVEIKNVGGGNVYSNSNYPTEDTKNMVKIKPKGITCEEPEIRLVDGSATVDCEFTSEEKVSNFQEFPISIEVEYRYYTTDAASITVLPFEIKDKSKFKNDIITLEDYVASSELKIGENGRIEFWVTNNGDKNVEDVEVNFFDILGVQVPALKCERADSSIYTTQFGNGAKCVFEKLRSLENRRVEFTFQSTENTRTISFYIKYPYSGSRVFAIPIIDDDVLKEPPVKYYMSDPTYGPVSIDFDSEGQTVTKDKQTVKEYWGRKRESAKLEIKFSHKGSASNLGTRDAKISDLILPEESVKLKLIGSEETANCKDFEKNEELVSTKEIKPMSSRESEKILTCYFKTDVKELWKIVNAEVNFDYTYQFISSQTITIKKA